MASIRVDEETAEAFAAQAARHGLSLPEYLRRLALQSGTTGQQQQLTAAEFDSLVDELGIEAPPLPADFTRADILGDHA